MLITQANLNFMGGAEKVVLRIAEHYKAKIYTAEYDKRSTFEEFENLDVEVIGGRGYSVIPYGRVMQGLKYGSAFYNMRIREDYDVINAHVAPSHWIRRNNRRVLWYCHTPLREIYDLYNYRMRFRKFYKRPLYAVGADIVRRIDRNVVNHIEMIVANSTNTQSRIVKYFGREDSEVLNGGVDYKDYHNGEYGNYFLYPSRISPNKRQEFAIRAFERFRKTREGKGYKLFIVGQVSKDGMYNDYYSRIVELARRVGDVRIVTDSDDNRLRKLYSNCTAVLYPPINEDYGLVPLEGMASGKPVIAVNEGGPRETVVHERTGWLVNDEREMARFMGVLAKDKGLAERMGRSGRARVIDRYSWKRFFSRFDRYIDRVRRG